MFHKIISFILEREGGYVNHPSDPGGATKYGITQRTFDAWNDDSLKGRKDVKLITIPEAITIYWENYWDASWEKLGFALAACMMDTAVNMGRSRANRFLKGCGGNYVKFLQLRLVKYKDLITANPKLKVFERGWNNRMTHLRRFIDNELSNSGGSK